MGFYSVRDCDLTGQEKIGLGPKSEDESGLQGKCHDGDLSDDQQVYSQGLPNNELEDDTTLNTADATATTADQSAALAGIQRFPTTNEDIVQRFRASLQQLISDAAKQGIDLSTTEGLMSPHNLSAPNQQATRLRSMVVIPTPDAPLKTRRDPTNRPEILSERLARGSREHKEENDSDIGRYGRNELSDDESGSPFTNGVLRMPFPERFRMPPVELFKKDTDPKEHVRRLPAASISSFSELSKAFSRQFLGNVHRKKLVAHLSQLKQGKDESLKKYLGRFSQKVSEIGSANDEAIIAAFINNLQNGQLSFDLRRARLTSYADMMDMDGGYALAEEEEIATGGYFVHGGRPDGAKTKDQAKAPDKGDKLKNKARDGRDGRRAYDPKTDQPRQKF
ncbi:hypothetical protein Q3G72_011959 [Acer saccharum]|nr:hypothetical protein Q3G72_011959 [Acer saccharum]